MAAPLPDKDHSYRPVLLGWSESQNLEEVAELITTQVQLFLGIDRVMVYRFDADYNGQVIAEAVDESRLPTMRGLHFPGGDIPPQARTFLMKARQRVIVDVASKQKTLLSRPDDAAAAFLDASDIRYSPVDACHLQYLLGMGVLSSITFSIVHQGKLWGLLVGHHSDSRQFAEAEIQTVQLWVDQFSVALAQDLLRQQVRQQQRQEALLNKVSLLMDQETLTDEGWLKVLQVIATDLDAEGCRLYLLPSNLNSQKAVYTYGVQPVMAPEGEDIWPQFCMALSPLTSDLDQEVESSPILFGSAQRWESSAEGKPLKMLFESSEISSVLVLPLHCQDEVIGYLSFYRQAETLEITWAGHDNDDHRNHRPRASFAAWQEQRQRVRPWGKTELALARSVVRHLYMGLMQHWIKTRINRRSAHDVMTNLPNWLLFNQQLNLAILQCLRQGRAFAVGILNLDQFKRINTAYGQTFGNYLLQSVAHRLNECLKLELQHSEDSEFCMLARWHGDRFAFLLPADGGQEAINHQAQKLLACLRRPFSLQGEEVYLTASLGIAVAPYDGSTADALIQHAETAMYQAKQQGSGSYLIYSQVSQREGSLSYQRLANDLYRALTQQELELYFQPQGHLQTENIIGVEALVRWQHPQLGLISPDRFIPIAEETGLIGQLDEWVLRTACWQYRQWRQAGLPPLRLAVNLSATQFQSSRLVKLVKEVLQDTEIPAHELELEITEETVTRDIQKAVNVLNQLKEMGVQIALDDFGTGYSSLNVLKHFPVDTLKIDKSFVRNCPQNVQDAAIVQTIVALGHGLKLNVLAEGVETPEQVAWLQSLACDHLQGYYLSRPQPASAMAEWLWAKTIELVDRPQQLHPETVWHSPSPSQSAHYQVKTPPLLTGGSRLSGGSRQSQRELATMPETADLVPVSISSMTAVLQPNRVHHQLQREQLIRSVTEKIRQSLHLDDILSTIVEEVRHLLITDRVILYKFADNWEGSVVEESVSPHYRALLGLQIVDKCFAEKYVKYYRQGRVRAIEDVNTADIADCHRDFLKGLDVRANLVMPVAYQDQLWGLLIAHHCRGPRPWQQDEVALLGQLAVQAAIAIHQGELYQQLEISNRELQKLSSQDRLTQIANRHRFDQRLQEEWLRLKRSQEPLSLIICDIDYFKLYNDTYGHPAGDRCLQQVAKVLSNAAQRPGDLAARYGGEEFVVLMADTDAAGAHLVAERIQEELKRLAIPHGASPLQRVTLSLGIACQVPDSETSPERLIQQADGELYRAKAAGRNQIQVHEPQCPGKVAGGVNNS